MTPVESVLGMIGFLTVLTVVAHGLVYALDRTLDKFFGIWNPLEEIELNKDEL